MPGFFLAFYMEISLDLHKIFLIYNLKSGQTTKCPVILLVGFNDSI